MRDKGHSVIAGTCQGCSVRVLAKDREERVVGSMQNVNMPKIEHIIDKCLTYVFHVPTVICYECRNIHVPLLFWAQNQFRNVAQNSKT